MKKICALFAGSLLFLIGLYANASTTFSNDVTNAYKWAYNYWITSLPLEKARLNEPVTRQAAAKMFVKFAVNALGQTPDYSKSCNFSDPDIVADLVPYVQKSCQLGLMGQNATSFNPYGNLTLAQFGAILSRILWWEAYEGTSPYYVGHLRALQEYWILKSYWDPTKTLVTRWDVLELLQKSYTVKMSTNELSSNSDTASLTQSKIPTDYDYRNAHIIARLNQSWGMDVLENYSTYFAKEHEGITRRLPQSFMVWDKVYNVLIENIDVADKKFKASSNGKQVAIKIWDASEPVRWLQNYSIAYSAYWFVNDYARRWYIQLYWDILPKDFDTNVKEITAEIMFPKAYPDLRSEDVLITINGKTATADSFLWKVDLSSDRVVINYTKWVSAFQGMNVVIKFPMSDYFTFDLEKQKSLVDDNSFNTYSNWDSAFSWVNYADFAAKIKELAKDNDSHLLDLLKLEDMYNTSLESLSWSLDTYVNTHNLDAEDPKVAQEVLTKAKELQLKANKEYRENLQALKTLLNEKDEEFKLAERIDETVKYLNLSDWYVDALMEVLVPMYSTNYQSSNSELSKEEQEKMMWNTFSLFGLSMTYSLKTDAYNTYLTDWATEVYKKVSRNTSDTPASMTTSKVFAIKSEIEEDWAQTHWSALFTGENAYSYSTIHTWYDEPRNEFKEDWRYKDFRDFTSVNAELAAKMREMKLRATACPNIYSQQVWDDGTYNKRKHYYWNNDKKTMILMDGVYFIYECSDYDKYAYVEEDSLSWENVIDISIWR